MLFLGEREVIVPVIDDDVERNGGNKLLGFVMLQPIVPRKLSARRGEIAFDMEEGGPPPLIPVGVGDLEIENPLSRKQEYVPPPHGGGKCISGKDCYNFNGTCPMGLCVCKSKEITGTYCQLYRPAAALMTTDQLRKKVRLRHHMLDDEMNHLVFVITVEMFVLLFVGFT
jgi:hypothetical protein